MFLYALKIHHVVGKTAGYSPNFCIKFGLASNLALGAVRLYNSSCQANAIIVYLRIVADVRDISNMNGKVIRFPGACRLDIG